MKATIPFRPSRGQAAEVRVSIRALEDVGQMTGDMQYRSQTGAQVRLAAATATGMILKSDGGIPYWATAT